MATENPEATPPGITVKVPTLLTLKDLITIISVAVSLTVAWGVFSTRITILEREVVSLREVDKVQGTATERLRTQVRRLESHQQDSELLLDQVFILLKRPIPIRRGNDQ